MCVCTCVASSPSTVQRAQPPRGHIDHTHEHLSPSTPLQGFISTVSPMLHLKLAGRADLLASLIDKARALFEHDASK